MATDPGAFTQVPRDLRLRVGILLGITLMLAVGFVLYVLYARGAFEATQRLILVAENAEGVSIGMPLTFSGFPIGRVRRIALAENGLAHIEVEVPLDEARWLRASSVFTLERGLVGAARIRAFTGDLEDVPLPDGAVRSVLRGDATEEIPRMVATLRSALENIEEMTAAGGSLQGSLENLRSATEQVGARLGGRHGALGAVLGNDEDARKVIAAIERANALLTSLAAASRKLDGVLDKADQRIFGQGGVMEGTERAALQLNTLLGEVRERLSAVDRILADLQAVSGNAKAASTDLATLRAEVDASVRRISSLIEEINRRLPFQRDSEIRLP